MSRFTSLPETDGSYQEIEEKMKKDPFLAVEALRPPMTASVEKAGR